MTAYFDYGHEATNYLSKTDKKLAEVIAKIGHIDREVDADLFRAMTFHIVGQQISNAALATVWERMQALLGEIVPESVANAAPEDLQKCGTTHRKVEYIQGFAQQVVAGEFDLQAIPFMDDDAAIEYLSSVRGIGRWTAEMLLLFCLQRPDVLAFDDLAIHRGLRMVYRHKEITRERFERYRRRFSPYGSVASLYLWAVAGGAIPELTDPAKPAKPKKPAKAKPLMTELPRH